MRLNQSALCSLVSRQVKSLSSIKFRRVKEPCPSDYDRFQERGAGRERQAGYISLFPIDRKKGK